MTISSSKTLSKFLFTVPDIYKDEFEQELISINIFRAKLLSFVVMLLNIILGLIPDAYFYFKGYWWISQGYKYWTLMHGLFAIFCMITFFIFNKLDNKKDFQPQKYHSYLLILFSVLFLSLCGGITMVDQMMGNTVTVYIMGLVIIATLFYFPVLTNLIMFFGSMIAMFLLLPIVQHDQITLFSHYITISEMAIGMWLVSILLFSMKSHNFYFGKTIEKQKEQIQFNVEELHRTNLKLIISNNRYSKLNEEKNDLLNLAVHDLKNPLSGILGLAQLIVTTPDLPRNKIDEYVTLIHDSSKRMIKLIENILNANAMERGDLDFTFADCDLVAIVWQVVQNHKNLADKKNIKLDFKIDSNVANVYTDKSACTQIIDNILSNAVKFSNKESNINIFINSDQNIISCSIQDHGPGLSEEDQKNLFKKYAVLSAKPTGGEHSSRLGLSIVKKLADAIGAKISYESKLGDGTTFTISFNKSTPE